MTTVAVTGAAGRLGRALLSRLDADPDVERVIGIDLREPEMPPPSLEHRVSDVRDPVLGRALAGADVVVHLAGRLEAPGDDAVRFARTVHGTRNLLACLPEVGAQALVHLSTAMAYGALPDNPVPLPDDAALRAAPEVPRAYQARLAEELVDDFAAAHPDVAVATLRPVTVLGEGLDTAATRLLEAPVLPLVAGYAPPVQVVDVDDVAAAAHVAVASRLRGPCNIAPEGWLTTEEAAAALGRRPLRVPEVPAYGAAAALRRGLHAPLTPAELAYVMHPWVVDPARLRAAGWHAAWTHRDVLRRAAARHGPWIRLGPMRARRRTVAAAAALGSVAATSLVWRGLSRRR